MRRWLRLFNESRPDRPASKTALALLYTIGHSTRPLADLVESLFERLDGPAAGAQVGHLPAYSPDFNPIEGCIAKLQTALRSFKARTKRKLSHALAKALTWITQQDIHGWFEHAGSVSSLK